MKMFHKSYITCMRFYTISIRSKYIFAKNLQTTPDFTKNQYKIQRGNYGYIESEHVNFFKNVLGENGVLTDLSDLEKYNVDWFQQYRGACTIVLKPRTTEEVSKILQFCNNNKLAVCPQGGNTGVLGGSIPVFDEIIISSELMNEIIHINETAGTIVCQAGCILENLDNCLAEKGLMVPLDLGARGSCHIGGNVSTNAGGIRMLRYGNLHGNILGLEAVRADGEVIDCLSTLKKDNTGYHLKHLFIGSEGTLGFVTKVAIQCAYRPKSFSVAFLGCQDFKKILKTYKKAKLDLGEILSAVEVIDAATMEFVGNKLNLHSPIGEYPYYLLIETAGSEEQHDTEKMNAFLESALLQHFILNGTATSEPTKMKAIWEIRERIPETFKKHVYCYDVSLSLDDYFTLVDDMKKHLGEKAEKVFGFGHLGDGNLHIQVATKGYDTEILKHIEPYIFNRVIELKGSISAEHGMGFSKGKYLKMARAPHTFKLMRNLKKMMDPNGILNPYKMFPYSIDLS